MGLAICQKIVFRHNGRIEVSTAPGQGAKFTVYLPPKDAHGRI
jgi:two-component system phosphate regulon sensor histidine kinase PhoR